MTKLKNTKKGMAKKALSISLVAAMLATSNVPVWAAEFSDGTDAAPVVEAPVVEDTDSADVFTSAPVEEAPVVEETPVVQASSSVYDDTKLSAYKTGEWGHKISLPTNGIKYTDDGTNVTGTLIAYWTYNGKQIGQATEVAVDPNVHDSLGSAISSINNSAPTPTKDQCIEEGEFGLNLVIWVNGAQNFAKNYNFGAAQKIDLTQTLANNNAASKVTFKNCTYNGKEQKPDPTYSTGNTYLIHVQRGNENLGIEDFAWDYVRTINGQNDLISADAKAGSKVKVVAKVTAPGYTGSFEKTNAFTINQKSLTDATLDINLNTLKYEFTGDTITPAKADITVIDNETGDNLSAYIDTVEQTPPDGWVGTGKKTKVTLDVNKPATIAQNYKTSKSQFDVDDDFEVIKRDLSKCKIKLNGDYQAGELDAKIANNRGFTWGTEITIYDENDKQLGTESQQTLYKLLSNKVVKEGSTYYVVVESNGKTVSTKKADDQLVNSLKQEIASPDLTLRDYKVYLNDNGKRGTLITKDDIRREYTQEPYILDEDDIILYDQVKQRQLTGESKLFTVECDQSTNEGVHWIKIHGTGSYTGSTLTVYYTVNRAEYASHKLNKKVVINSSFTKAEDYADAIDLEITAKNGETPAKTFILKPEDVNVDYEFDKYDTTKYRNGNFEHNKITVTATITNEDFLKQLSGKLPSGVKQNADGTITITEKVEIVHPSIQDAKVEIIGDYTFTGEKIIPEVKVTAANGTILKEGVDYRLDVKHGLHAGKAEVVLTALADDNGCRIYEEGSTSTGNFFTINPANINDIKAKGSFKYNGEAQTPDLNALDLRLGDNSIKDLLNPVYPNDFKNNVNAGTATVNVTVKDAWKDDFTASNADISFVIVPVSINKTVYDDGAFAVYAENGHILNFTAFEGFIYDGTAKTFKDADYENDNIAKAVSSTYKLKKGTDYTIGYASNVNPDRTGKDQKTAYVYAVLSSNFRIDSDVVGKKYQPTITTQDGETITNVVAEETFRISKASVANAAVSITNPTYNLGGKAEPTVVVTVDGKTLEEGKDYELVYGDNTSYNAGAENTVTVKGINGYVASEKTEKWTVAQKDIASEDITVSLDNTAYKPGAEPKVTVLDGRTVVDADEYTVAYTDKEAGKLTIQAAGKNYKGSKEVTYEVTERANLADAVISDIADVVETGAQITPAVTVTLNNIRLEEGKDYTVSYGENTAAGEGTVTITAVEGSVDYTGTQTKTFNIVEKANLANVTISEIPPMKETGKQITPAITVMNGNVILVEGTDYTVSYGENVEAGEGKGSVTITAVEGNAAYKGSQTKTFDIVAMANLADAKVSVVPNMVATGEQLKPTVTVTYGNINLEEGKDYTVSYGENVEVGEGTVTITAVEGSETYKGSQTVKFEITAKAPEVGSAMIEDVKVVGNKATVILSGPSDNATGYDYVISTENDYTNGRLVNGINKNQLSTETTYQYLQKGVYYAYCHAWKRGEDGKKVFGEWSNIFRFEVGAVTPDRPVITSVSVKGSTVTVNYTKAKNATGYDVVLGTTTRKVYGEERPVEYGELVSKVTNGDKVTATFKNVPAGTYYAGLHAYNRTSADNKKVFSPWSNVKKVIVK